jgi:hypothetical protein
MSGHEEIQHGFRRAIPETMNKAINNYPDVIWLIGRSMGGGG